MDHGWTNDQPILSLHQLDGVSVRENLKKFPDGYNPYINHYEEHELDSADHYLVTGGPLVHQIPPEFGVLAHPNPRNGKYYLRFTKGDFHGMARPEDNGEYEANKFNQRLNPRADRVGNYRGDKANVRRTEDDMKAGSLAQFPDVGGPLTTAPFRHSGLPFAKPKKEQHSPFFAHFWVYPELRDLLIGELYTFVETLSNLSRTCQEIREPIDRVMSYFDINRLDCLRLDKSPAQLRALVENGKMSQAEADNLRVPQFLMVGPVRYQTKMAPGYAGDHTAFWPPQVWKRDEQGLQPYERLFTEFGFREEVGYTHKSKDFGNDRKCAGLQKTLRAFYRHQRNFRFVSLVRLDFMNLQTLEAILDGMVNLRGLAVYSCPLIDLSQVRGLIKIVGRINEARAKANKAPLDLDIAPQIRQGRIRDRMGSYGITHSDPTLYNNWGTDIGRALAASLVSLLREADKAGIQLCQPGKAFRLWLDRLPLHVNQTFSLCVAAANYLDNEKNRLKYAHEVYPSRKDDGLRAQLLERFDQTVALDLVIAGTAAPVKEKEIEQMTAIRECTTCGEKLPCAFFRAEAQKVTCEGCELNFQLEWERGNSLYQKGAIAGFLWKDAPEISLNWLFEDSTTAPRNWRNFHSQARQLPTNEELLQQAEPIERERQAIVEEMNELYDKKDKQPLAKKVDEKDEQIELLRARAGFERTPNACLATTYDWDYRRRAYTWRVALERGEDLPDRPYETTRAITFEKAYNMLH
ncbi:hypothetical protein SCUP515_06582 [Seiridium cupressi]